MKLPDELLARIRHPRPKSFYLHRKCSYQGKVKDKFKIYFKDLLECQLHCLIVCTSQDYREDYPDRIIYHKTDIQINNCISWLKETGYINIGSSNGLFDFISFDDFKEFHWKHIIEFIGTFFDIKYEEIYKTILSNRKSIRNFESSFAKFIPENTEDINSFITRNFIW